MKTISTLLLFTLLTTTAWAQQFSIGVHGGMHFYSKPFGVSDQFTGFNNNATSVYGGRIAVGLSKLQLGIGINLAKLNASYAHTIKGPVTGITGIFFDHESDIINPYLFANLQKGLGPVQLYYGINAGYLRISAGETQVYWTTLRIPVGMFYTRELSGISAGVQLGGRVGIVKGLGLFAEGSARYNTNSYDMPVYSLTGFFNGHENGKGFLSFPVVLGVDYRL